jgi:hypothetical protein
MVLPASIRNDPNATIPPDVWNNLSYQQKGAVFALRDNTNTAGDNEREVASLHTQDIVNDTESGNANNRTGRAAHASNAFGSRSGGKNT